MSWKLRQEKKSGEMSTGFFSSPHDKIITINFLCAVPSPHFSFVSYDIFFWKEKSFTCDSYLIILHFSFVAKTQCCGKCCYFRVRIFLKKIFASFLLIFLSACLIFLSKINERFSVCQFLFKNCWIFDVFMELQMLDVQRYRSQMTIFKKLFVLTFTLFVISVALLL